MKIIRAQYRFGTFLFDAARGDLRQRGERVPAGAQALALLAALLERAGALVTKDDLLQSAWPGLTVEEGNISVQMHRLRQMLGDVRKPYRWIATEPGRGYRFIGAVERDAGAAAAPPAPGRGADLQATSVSSPSGPMIGRERELAALLAMMPGHRLVTITGPGGMGKTRLAMEFALEHAADPLNRILFLGLEGLRQRDQIVFRLAAQLGMQPSEGARSARDLAARLRNEPYVLILDNCEHVLDEAAGLAEIFLTHAPCVSLVATSREPLRLAGERILALEPLECPGPAAQGGSADIGFFAAVRLFSQTAMIADPDFRLDDETAPLVAQICRKVEGIPLALQLAAARLSGMTLPALLEGLSAPRRLPAIARPGAPARHRTVEATIAWSVALLSDAERAALRRLSIFSPDFTMTAAQQVIADELVGAADVPDFVNGLVEKSLLVRQASGRRGESRFRLPESTRHFAMDMLSAAGELAAMRENLANYVAALFGRARDEWAETDSGLWLSAYAPEIENLRAALDWAFSADGNNAMRVKLGARLRAPFADRLITLREHSAATNAAVAALTPDTPAEDAGWVWFSASYDPSPDKVAHGAAALQAMSAFFGAGNIGAAGLAASRVPFWFSLAGEPERADQHIAQAVAALPAIALNRYRSGILLNLGTCFAIKGNDANLQTALAYFSEAQPIARQFSDQIQIALIGANLAEIEAVRGDYGAAIAQSQNLAAESRARRDERRLNHDLTNLLTYALLAGEIPVARQAAREAIPLLLALEDQHWGTDHGCMFAMLAAACGAWRIAALLAGFSRHYHETHGATRGVIEARVLDKLNAAFAEAAAAGWLSEADFTTIMDEGAKISFAEALKLALTI